MSEFADDADVETGAERTRNGGGDEHAAARDAKHDRLRLIAQRLGEQRACTATIAENYRSSAVP